MSTTDRMPSLDSRREITDRVGQTVVLGNSVVSGAASFTPTMTAVPRGKSTATGKIIAAAAGALSPYNGSIGLWTATINSDATALLQCKGVQGWNVNYTMASVSTLTARGTSIAAAEFSINPTATLVYFVSNSATIQATALLQYNSSSVASGAAQLVAAANFTGYPNAMAAGAFSASALASATYVVENKGDLYITASQTSVPRGASIASGAFSSGASFTIDATSATILRIAATGSLAITSASIASSSFNGNATA